MDLSQGLGSLDRQAEVTHWPLALLLLLLGGAGGEQSLWSRGAPEGCGSLSLWACVAERLSSGS